MQEKPIRPIIEDDDEPQQMSKATPEKPVSPWLRNLAVVVLLVAVAVAGFASSAGWFDSDTGQGTEASSSTAAPTPPETPVASNAPDAAAPQPNSPLASVPQLSPLLPKDGAAVVAEATRVIEHLETVLPQSLETQEIKARFEYEFGKVETAREVWEAILEQEPKFVYALRGLGDICLTEGQLEDAVRYFRRAVLAEPDNLSRQLTLGAAMLQAGQIDEAEKVLLALLEKNDQASLAHAELGRVYLQKKDFESAVQSFKRALEGAPENAQTHLGLATALARVGQREEARTHQERHVALRDANRTQLETGRKEYDDTAAMRIDIGNVYVNTARVYMANGYAAAAEMVLLRAARLDEKNLEARQALSFLSGQKNKPFDAIRWMKEVADIAKAEFSYAEEVARLYMGLQQIDEAEKTLVAFVDNNPDNIRALRSVARFYVEAKPTPEKAVELAEQATKLDPSATGHATLASTYERVGRIADAAKEMRKAAELDPSNTVYSQTAALLEDQIPTSPTDSQQTP
ncbi:MAG: hypothetical protein Aurels2KO_26200 [Aureliella sp.]